MLERALAISDTGWIAGIGKFDDGFGGVSGTYDRVFMLQLPSTITLPGDYNDDGSVDAADYVAWRDKLETDTTLPNDTTPGSVDPEDYNVWRENFGATASQTPGLSSASPVPEPSALLVSLISSIGLAPSLRRRQPMSASI
jgi:hypothetical protein